MKEEAERHIYRYLLVAAAGAIAVGTIFYHLVEHFSWLNAYYFSVVTLATVGYGDLYPHTAAGKIFTTVYLFVGVGIITAAINYAIRHGRVARRLRNRHKEKL